MRVALVNPPWRFDHSIYFGCRDPHLPLELGYARALLEASGHETLLLDGHLCGLDEAALESAGAAHAMVTGSGPTAFGLYPSVDEAVAAAEKLRESVPGTSRSMLRRGRAASTSRRSAAVVRSSSTPTVLLVQAGSRADARVDPAGSARAMRVRTTSAESRTRSSGS